MTTLHLWGWLTLLAAVQGPVALSVPTPCPAQLIPATHCGGLHLRGPCFEQLWADGTTKTVQILLPTTNARPAFQILEPRTELFGQPQVLTTPWTLDLRSWGVVQNLDLIDELEHQGHGVDLVEPGTPPFDWTIQIQHQASPFSIGPHVDGWYAMSDAFPHNAAAISPNVYLPALRAYGPPGDVTHGPTTLDRIRAHTVARLEPVEQRVKVAVIDTGIDRDHDDLVQIMGEGMTCGPAGCRSGPGLGHDVRGHGTKVAAAIASERFGVAHDVAQLLPVQVVDDSGCVWSDDLEYGVRYAAREARIVVMALDIPTYATSLAAVESARSIIANDPDTLFIVAAGNNDSTPLTAFWGRAEPNVLVVGGIDHGENPEAWSENHGDHIDLAAPSVGCVVSEWSDTNNLAHVTTSGTTLATGYVAGVAAHILASDPGLSVEELWDRLVATADCAGLFQHCGIYGNEACCDDCGVVDLACALDPQALDCTPPNRCSTSPPEAGAAAGL